MEGKEKQLFNEEDNVNSKKLEDEKSKKELSKTKKQKRVNMYPKEKISKNSHYLFIKDGQIEFRLTNKEIERKYGIKNIRKKLLIEISFIIDGYLVIEDDVSNNRFKKINIPGVGFEDYEYYLATDGYIQEVNKKTRERKKLTKYLNQNNMVMSKGSLGQIFNVTELICRYYFHVRLVDSNQIVYLDKNKMNCSVSNMSVH